MKLCTGNVDLKKKMPSRKMNKEAIHMKKATLDATDENILQSIADQIGNRNARVFEFIKTLDSINDNRFISLDARWGEGKTFYVRQIEKTLEYQTLKKFGTDDTIKGNATVFCKHSLRRYRFGEFIFSGVL